MFGKRLKQLRCSHNLSMDKLVELYNQKYDAKMNKSTLSRYENGMQDPIYTVVVNFADFFEVTVDYLSGHTPTLSDVENQLLHNYLLDNYQQLNALGKKKVEEYMSDMLSNPKYTISSTPFAHEDDTIKWVAYGGGTDDDTVYHT